MFREIRRELKAKCPLIHAITNPISIHLCANSILAVGARPIMAEHPKEVQEITERAKALMLNLGNITDARMESMGLAFQKSRAMEIPVVLDVVGIACSQLRKNYVFRLLEMGSPTVIKGNYSEIKALYDLGYACEGVDADLAISDREMDPMAFSLAKKYNTVILATGKTDVVTDGKRLFHVRNGSAQLAEISGTGCMLGAICSAYVTAGQGIEGALAACVTLGICGQIAETPKGNGSFMVRLLDALSTLSDQTISKQIRLEEIHLETL